MESLSVCKQRAIYRNKSSKSLSSYKLSNFVLTHPRGSQMLYKGFVYVIYLFLGIEIAKNEEHETLLHRIQKWGK